ncbi:hypothetical protein H6F86_24950 [Phormidium sp. FACHB-592]|uniref:Transposase family protein n=1 Tax=Stenomitos frigidus AS-A4 TaxID=2933935 RepID=A0ABV0KQ17_9CYAN|nr:hypothetical protein [Phormidium sp. FACHB-592]
MSNQALGYEKQLPEREPYRLEAVLNQCPSLAFIVDETERGVNRSKGKAERKQYYNGTKKTFTIKNNLITQCIDKVLFLSGTYEGKKHDKAIREEEDYKLPEGSKLWKDTSFKAMRQQKPPPFSQEETAQTRIK